MRTEECILKYRRVSSTKMGNLMKVNDHLDLEKEWRKKRRLTGEWDGRISDAGRFVLFTFPSLRSSTLAATCNSPMKSHPVQ